MHNRGFSNFVVRNYLSYPLLGKKKKEEDLKRNIRKFPIIYRPFQKMRIELKKIQLEHR